MFKICKFHVGGLRIKLSRWQLHTIMQPTFHDVPRKSTTKVGSIIREKVQF